MGTSNTSTSSRKLLLLFAAVVQQKRKLLAPFPNSFRSETGVPPKLHPFTMTTGRKELEKKKPTQPPAWRKARPSRAPAPPPPLRPPPEWRGKYPSNVPLVHLCRKQEWNYVCMYLPLLPRLRTLTFLCISGPSSL